MTEYAYIAIIVLIFIYFVVYRKNKLAGNIGFIASSVAFIQIPTIHISLSLILLGTSIINTLYDLT